ncbi:surface protein like [Capsicum annuum]
MKIEARIDEEALMLPHCARFILAERPACFGLKEFALITDLNCVCYPYDSKYVKVMEIWIYEAFSTLNRGIGKSTKDPLPIPQLLRWHAVKDDKLIEGDSYLNGWSTKRVHPYLIPTAHEMKQHYMKNFKAFTDEPKNTFIDGLKAYMEKVRLRRAEKEKQKKRDKDEGVQVQSQHSAARVVSDDSVIKEELLEATALKQVSIKDDEVMIPKVAAVVERENLDEEENRANGSAGVEKEDYDEGKKDEKDKNEKSICVEENNEGDGEKAKEKNAGEVEKEEGEKHKEEGKNDAPEKEGITEKENENEFSKLDESLNDVTQDIYKMQVENKNVECLDNF